MIAFHIIMLDKENVLVMGVDQDPTFSSHLLNYFLLHAKYGRNLIVMIIITLGYFLWNILI